jgi:hypothetical protein
MIPRRGVVLNIVPFLSIYQKFSCKLPDISGNLMRYRTGYRTDFVDISEILMQVAGYIRYPHSLPQKYRTGYRTKSDKILGKLMQIARYIRKRYISKSAKTPAIHRFFLYRPGKNLYIGFPDVDCRIYRNI